MQISIKIAKNRILCWSADTTMDYFDYLCTRYENVPYERPLKGLE